MQLYAYLFGDINACWGGGGRGRGQGGRSVGVEVWWEKGAGGAAKVNEVVAEGNGRRSRRGWLWVTGSVIGGSAAEPTDLLKHWHLSWQVRPGTALLSVKPRLWLRDFQAHPLEEVQRRGFAAIVNGIASGFGVDATRNAHLFEV